MAIFCINTIIENAASTKNEGIPILVNSFIILLSNFTLPKVNLPFFLIKWGITIETSLFCITL